MNKNTNILSHKYGSSKNQENTYNIGERNLYQHINNEVEVFNFLKIKIIFFI